MIKKVKLGSLYMGDEPTSGKTRRYDTKIRPRVSIGDTVPGKEISWVPLGNLLIADRCLLTNVSWRDLDSSGLVEGVDITIDGAPMRCRLLGTAHTRTETSEWLAAMDELGDTPAFWHADDLMFWVREPAIGPGIQIVRGSSNDKSPSRLRMSNSFREDMRLPSIGFRPVLEFLVPPESVDDSFLGEALVVQNGTERLLGKLIEVTPYDLVLRAVPGSTLPKAGAGWFAKTVGEEHMIVVAREEIDDIIKW